jgi:hypothetical protein
MIVRGLGRSAIRPRVANSSAQALEFALGTPELLVGGSRRGLGDREADVGRIEFSRGDGADDRPRLHLQRQQASASPGERVRVGTAHTFQGGERDVVVLSLVAAANEPSRRFDWADQQRELWNVTITRARSHLVVVGDEAVWARRGGLGGELLAAAAEPALGRHPLAHDLAERIYTALASSGADPELGVMVHGHRADAVVKNGASVRPVVVDIGADRRADPAAHLRWMLRYLALLGDDAVRLPTWSLYDNGRRPPHPLRAEIGTAQPEPGAGTAQQAGCAGPPGWTRRRARPAGPHRAAPPAGCRCQHCPPARVGSEPDEVPDGRGRSGTRGGEVGELTDGRDSGLGGGSHPRGRRGYSRGRHRRFAHHIFRRGSASSPSMMITWFGTGLSSSGAKARSA